MGEGFPAETHAVSDAGSPFNTMHVALNQWRAHGALDPPRSIPHTVVKRPSADDTAEPPWDNRSVPPLPPRGRAVVARRAHNPKVSGSNPLPATVHLDNRRVVRSTAACSSRKGRARTILEKTVELRLGSQFNDGEFDPGSG